MRRGTDHARAGATGAGTTEEAHALLGRMGSGLPGYVMISAWTFVAGMSPGLLNVNVATA